MAIESALKKFILSECGRVQVAAFRFLYVARQGTLDRDGFGLFFGLDAIFERALDLLGPLEIPGLQTFLKRLAFEGSLCPEGAPALVGYTIIPVFTGLPMSAVNGEHDPSMGQNRVHANTQEAKLLIIKKILWRRDRDSNPG